MMIVMIVIVADQLGGVVGVGDQPRAGDRVENRGGSDRVGAVGDIDAPPDQVERRDRRCRED